MGPNMIGILALNFKNSNFHIRSCFIHKIIFLQFVILKAYTINILPVFSKCSLKVIDLEILFKRI